MKLVMAAIPEDPDDQVVWLEQQLVGLDLGRLVGQLATLHGPARGAEPSFSLLFTPYLAAVLQVGLTALPRDLVRELLRHPRLLLELQERVLTEGGPYWDRVQRADADLQGAAEAGWRRLQRVAPAADVSPGPRLPWYRRAWVASLATAAAALVAVGLWQAWWPGSAAAPTAWGWDRPGALPAGVSRGEYLRALAAVADEWSRKQPVTAPELARRILQFRQGCTTLLLADHEPLPEADRDWLKERCRRWAAKLDAELAALEAGKDVEAVRRAVDETVRQLAAALRERAA